MTLRQSSFDSGKSMAIVPAFPRVPLAEAPFSVQIRTIHDEARYLEVQTRPPHGRKHLGPSQEPGEQAVLRPRPTWPAALKETVRLRHPAAGETEAQGLL